MRRAFLKGLALGSVAWREALAAEAPGEKVRQLAAVEVLRVEGRREVRGAHQQHQANPAHMWSPPAEYHEPDDAPARVVPVSAPPPRQMKRLARLNFSSKAGVATPSFR